MARTAGAQDLKDACGVLEYLIHDLIVAHQLYDLFVNIGQRADVKLETERAVRRMYVSYLVLALCKLSEFLSHYKWMIPDNAKSACKPIEQELSRRGVKRLRNTFIGHILNKDTGRPITEGELNAAFNAATDNDVPTFLRWIHVSGNTTSPNTVVGILEGVHAGLRKQLAT